MSEVDPLESVVALADATRRALYRFVADSRASVSRDEAAEGTGLKRSLVAYHLDRLTADGLLVAEFTRPPGRGGPGAGRPAKRYRRARTEVGVSLPPRSYRTAAEILLNALIDADVGIGTLQASAREFGLELGADGVDAALAALGFEPWVNDDETVLCNCPFASLRAMDLETTCGMNLALVEGIVEAAGRTDLDCILLPDDDYCCVRLRPRPATDADSDADSDADGSSAPRSTVADQGAGQLDSR